MKRKTLSHLEFAQLALAVKNSEQLIRGKINSGVAITQIASDMNVSVSAISNALKANGIPFGRVRKNSPDMARIEALETVVRRLSESLGVQCSEIK